MNDRELFEVRKGLVQVFLRRGGYDGILLSRVDNFAMATGGKRNYVNVSGDLGACSMFITRDGAAYYVGNNIEQTRVMAEELDGLGCEIRSFLWFESSAAEVVRNEFSGDVVSDDGSVGKNVHGELRYLRALLSEGELEKYRVLGRFAAEAMTATLESIDEGDAEADIAAKLVAEGMKRRCLVPVALVAADDRIVRHRHPLPTYTSLRAGLESHAQAPSRRERVTQGDENRVARYVMVVGGFVREGLSVSITRFKRVAELPPEVADSYHRICGVDALVQEATTPGRTLGEVFEACQAGYKKLGFGNHEWYNHHQGGTTGYGARTCKGSPGESFFLLDTSWQRDLEALCGIEAGFGHALAWNPSGPGVKSEDTFLLLPDGRREIVSGTPSLPRVDLAGVLGRPTEVVKSEMA